MTPRMFVSGIVQFNSAGTSVGSNVRLRWEYAPGSELFVVYTDTHGLYDLFPDRSERTDRSLIIKFSRMFDVFR